MAIEMLLLTPGSGSFFEFREPRFLWGRSAIWCGSVNRSGYQQFSIGFCLSQVDIGDKAKLIELKGGAWLKFLPAFFCSKHRWGA
jgi:hypothetical protein